LVSTEASIVTREGEFIGIGIDDFKALEKALSILMMVPYVVTLVLFF